MTQTYPNTPYSGQLQESREEFHVMGGVDIYRL